ncbi:hypothetical protein J132_05909 [Termitomyces sp. J132]|nr:hypothetical protein J132_05909 [Termitomyces sp. J132]
MFLRLHARAFHSRPAAVKKIVAKPSKIFLHKLNADPDTAFIKIGGKHEFLKSPAEALALIRDVERRFGSVQTFQFRRDSDRETCYQAFVHVAFKDPAVYQRLPTKPTEFTFKPPSVESNRPGGVGLEDLKPFLETQLPEQTSDFSQSPENEESTPGEMISYTVTGSKDNLILPSMYTKTADVSSKNARHFLEWGGFHSLKPISSETELRIENVFRPNSIDHFRMRCVLRRYSKENDLPNPYEALPGQELETALQKHESFEASDPVSASQDSTMPSDAVTLDLSASSSSLNAPQLDPPFSTTSTMSTSSTSPKPDTTPPSDKTTPSPKLKSPSPQPEASAQESVITSPSPVPSSSPTQSSETSTIDDIYALAAKMRKQAKSLKKANKKKEQRRKKMEANPLPHLSQEKPVQSSMRDVTKQFMAARQASNAKRTEQKKPKTIKQKISGFFSGLF